MRVCFHTIGREKGHFWVCSNSSLWAIFLSGFFFSSRYFFPLSLATFSLRRRFKSWPCHFSRFHLLFPGKFLETRPAEVVFYPVRKRDSSTYFQLCPLFFRNEMGKGRASCEMKWRRKCGQVHPKHFTRKLFALAEKNHFLRSTSRRMNVKQYSSYLYA